MATVLTHITSVREARALLLTKKLEKIFPEKAAALAGDMLAHGMEINADLRDELVSFLLLDDEVSDG